MKNNSEALVKSFLATLVLVLSNKELINSPNDSSKLLLVGILSLLTLVYSADQIIDTFKNVFGESNDVDITLLQLKTQEIDIVSPLSPREKDVLYLMKDGLMNKEIARNLSVSEATIKNHVTSILRKLNATVRTEAVVKALKSGLVNV
jgi:DNA-binding NarL/FixJ family response regulator